MDEDTVVGKEKEAPVDEPEAKADIEGRLDDFFGADDTAVSEESLMALEEEPLEPSIEEDITDSAATTVATEGDVEDRLADFFDEDETADGADDVETALQGVDVEHEADDDSDEEPLPFEGEEIAPALGAEVEEEETTPSTEEVGIDAAVEESFDDLFGDEVAEEAVVEPALGESEVHAAEALAGVDVETEADDDSDEVPLPVEDGELAPALATDEESADDLQLDETAEEAAAEVGDKFDAIFGEDTETVADEGIEEPTIETEGEVEEAALEVEDEVEEAALVQGDELDEAVIAPADEREEVAEAPADVFDEVEFEDDITAAVTGKPGDDEAQLTVDDEVAEDVAAPAGDFDTLVSGEEEVVPELSPEELEAMLLEGADVISAGDVPSGYPSADELLSETGEIAGDVLDADAVDFIVSVERPDGQPFVDEEVVFEAVEEDEEPVGEKELEFSDEFDESDTFGTMLLSEEPAVEDQPAESEEESQLVETVATAERDEVSEEIAVEESAAFVAPTLDIATQDSLAGMRSCIVSLGLEIDDKILASLSSEVEKLRNEWMDKPAEKTFVQLLSTVTNHIETYRYEADPQANKLLLSIFDKLEQCVLGQSKPEQIQEALLTETSKILQWQQMLIERTPVSERPVLDENVPDSELPADQVEAEQPEEDISMALDDMSKQIDAIGDDLLMQKVSSVMKSELEQLKSAFQAELKELKEEILRGRK